jgi:hypothetical protein
VPLNDPKTTGGMFIGRRPGTAPMRYQAKPGQAGRGRRAFDAALAAFLLGVETLLAISLWGPQPFGWLWVGSQVEYHSGSGDLGLLSAFGGMLLSMLVSVAILMRLDYAWKLVRRAAGHQQEHGALERIFVVSLTIAVTLYLAYFLFVGGIQPSIAPRE